MFLFRKKSTSYSQLCLSKATSVPWIPWIPFSLSTRCKSAIVKTQDPGGVDLYEDSEKNAGRGLSFFLSLVLALCLAWIVTRHR